jgi:hypothetical protein
VDGLAAFVGQNVDSSRRSFRHACSLGFWQT